MTKKFNLKVFNGRYIWRPVTGSRGIRRRYAWNETKACYEDPPNGPLYEARRIDTAGGNRVSKTFSLLQHAREWKERRNQNGHSETKRVVINNGYTLKQLIIDFKAKRFPLLSEGTVIFYERLFRSLTSLEGLFVDTIQPRDIESWLVGLTQPEQLAMRRSTRLSFDKELNALSVLLRWYIEENDDARLIFPIKNKHYRKALVRKRPTRKVVLSDSELEKWLGILKRDSPMFYAIAFIQTAQALRVSEVCAMKWKHLDLTAGRYEICEHVFWPRIQGRTSKLVPGTKTSQSTYFVPLWQDVQILLKGMMKFATDDLIFTINGNLLSYRQIQYAYDRAFKVAGLEHRGTHVCRHTGSTIFLDQTQDLQALQQLGGWKSQKMPQHYAKIRSQRAELAMRAAEVRKLRLIKPSEESGS